MTELEKYTSKQPNFKFLQILKWILGLLFKREQSPKKWNEKYFQTLQKETITKPIEKDKLRISWLGHASVLVQWYSDGETKNIIFDPIFTNKIQHVTPRITGVPISPQDLPEIDLCFISHDHYDHLDKSSLQKLKIKKIIGGTKLKTALPSSYDVAELAWWQSVKIDDVEITFVPAKHWSKRVWSARNKRLWGGFLIRVADRVIYFAGDTAYCDVAKKVAEKFGKIDLAILPIGCYEPSFIMEFHTNPEQAFQMYKSLGVKYFLPIHWGTYLLSSEPIYEPIQRLQKCFENSETKNLLALSIGGTVEI